MLSLSREMATENWEMIMENSRAGKNPRNYDSQKVYRQYLYHIKNIAFEFVKREF